MALPSSFDGRRLRRHAWTIPFKLTFALLFAFYLLRISPHLFQNTQYVLLNLPLFLNWAVIESGPIPPAVAAFFGLCALGWGLGYANSASKALASSMGVTELGPESPLTQRVHRMARALDLPPPKVATMRATNAYAIGSSRKDSAVVIGLPLIHSLQEDELDAVIGHELGHIISGDMRRMQMAAGFQSMVDAMTDRASAVGARQASNRQTGLLIFLVGQLLRKTLFLISELLVKRLSRTREYTADAFGALLTSPDAMARALRKLHAEAPARAECNARYAYLMFWNKGGRLLSTHPTLERRLNAIERGRHLNRVIAKGTSAPGARIAALVGGAARSARQIRFSGSGIAAIKGRLEALDRSGFLEDNLHWLALGGLLFGGITTFMLMP